MTNSDPSSLAKLVADQLDDLFSNHSNISRIISNLNLPSDKISDQYRHSDFSYESMLRVFIYCKTGGYSDNELSDRLHNWPYLQQRFNLERAPTQQALSYTWRNRFTREIRSFINDLADEIVAKAQEHNITSKDIAPRIPTDDDIDENQEPISHFVDNRAADFMEMARDHAFSAFDTGRASNKKYSDQRIFESQTKMSLMGERVGSREVYRMFNRKRDEAVHNDTHIRAIKKLATPTDHQSQLDVFNENQQPPPEWRRIVDTLQDPFSDAVSGILSSIRGTDMFKEPVTVAIDITSVPYYGSPWKSPKDVLPSEEPVTKNGRELGVPKEEYPEMVHGLPEDGERGYEYATLSVVAQDVPIVLAVEPVRQNSDWEEEDKEEIRGRTSPGEIVDRLMEKATQHVDIHRVLADRGFDTYGVKHTLNEYGVTYLLPKRKYKKDWDAIEKVQEHPTADVAVERNVPMCPERDEYSHDVTFLFVPSRKKEFSWTDEGQYAVFVTNKDISAEKAESMVSTYSYRWDIENEYKSIKRFLPSIASRDYRVRYFTFLFATLLYNVWRLVDHVLKVLVREKYDSYEQDRRSGSRLRPLVGVVGCVDTFLHCMKPPDCR